MWRKYLLALVCNRRLGRFSDLQTGIMFHSVSKTGKVWGSGFTRQSDLVHR